MATATTSTTSRRKNGDTLFNTILFPLCGGSSLKKISDSPLRITVKNNFYADHGGTEGTTTPTITSRYLAEKKSSIVSAASTSSNNNNTNTNNRTVVVPKTVYLVRHAESNENRRLECLARSIQHLKKLAIPEKEDIVASVELLDVTAQLDSDVSDVGKRQIAQLAIKLQRDNFMERNKIQLVAHSPLRRARQTSEGMLGCVSPRLIPEVQHHHHHHQHHQQPANNDDDGSSFATTTKASYDADGSTAGNSGSTRPVMVGPPCVPITLRRSNTGHGPHGTLPPEEYNSPGKNIPSVSKIVELPCLMERTPMEWLNPAALDIRIEEFEEWLDSIPEERIAVVGHSQYFKTMLGLNYKFKNCDVWQLTYVPRRTSSNMKENDEYEVNSYSTMASQGVVVRGGDTHIVQERMLSIVSSGKATLDGSTTTKSTSCTMQLNSVSKSWSDCDSTSEQPEENLNLPRGWSGLKMLYRYNPDEDYLTEEN